MIYSSPIVFRYLIPGLTAAILVAILQGIGQSANGTYAVNYMSGSRSQTGQGGIMLLGIVVTVAIAGLAGLIIGILYKIVNRYTEE